MWGPKAAQFALAAIMLAIVTPPAHGAVVVPANFDERPVVTGIVRPSALAFTPDGRMLIATTLGKVHVYENGALAPAPALELGTRVCANAERGLLGLSVDPAFATNHFVFAYYTFAKHGPAARSARRTLRSTASRASCSATTT